MERLASAGLSTLWLGGKPVPAGRPRVGKFGTYYAKPYQDWMKVNARVVSSLDYVPTDRPIALLVEVLCIPPKKTEHCAPMGDVDNFAKGPMDLLTKLTKDHGKGPWKDDRQIVSLVTVKRWIGPDEEPGFRLHWCVIDEDKMAQRVVEGRPPIGD